MVTRPKSKTTSEERRAQGLASIVKVDRDPATGRLIRKAPAGDPGATVPPTPPPPAARPATARKPRAPKAPTAKRPTARKPRAPKAPTVKPTADKGGAAPAANPFRGRLLNRHPRSSAYRRTSPPSKPSPKG